MLAAACTVVAGVLGGHLLVALLVAGLIVSGLVFERLIAGCRAAIGLPRPGRAGVPHSPYRPRCGLGDGNRGLVRAADRLDADPAGVQHASATFDQLSSPRAFRGAALRPGDSTVISWPASFIACSRDSAAM